MSAFGGKADMFRHASILRRVASGRYFTVTWLLGQLVPGHKTIADFCEDAPDDFMCKEGRARRRGGGPYAITLGAASEPLRLYGLFVLA